MLGPEAFQNSDFVCWPGQSEQTVQAQNSFVSHTPRANRLKVNLGKVSQHHFGSENKNQIPEHFRFWIFRTVMPSLYVIT